MYLGDTVVFIEIREAPVYTSLPYSVLDLFKAELAARWIESCLV